MNDLKLRTKINTRIVLKLLNDRLIRDYLIELNTFHLRYKNKLLLLGEVSQQELEDIVKEVAQEMGVNLVN